MKTIQILGPGCQKCQVLAERTRQAIEQLNLEATLEKVSSPADILSFGVMTTPALVVDGVVKVAGRVPTIDGIKQLIRA